MLNFERKKEILLKKADRVTICLNWQENVFDGDCFELTSCALLCNKTGKLPSEKEFIFYNQQTHASNSVHHSIYHRFGQAFDAQDDENCETIEVQFDSVPDDIQKILLAVTIFKAKERNQNFGQIEDAYLKIYNSLSCEEIYSCDLQEDFPLERTVILGSFVKNDDDFWCFSSNPIPLDGSIVDLASAFESD